MQDAIHITGEIKYHDYFGYDEHILLAEVGHYETEQYTKDIFCDIITKKFPNFAVHYSKGRNKSDKLFVSMATDKTKVEKEYTSGRSIESTVRTANNAF